MFRRVDSIDSTSALRFFALCLISQVILAICVGFPAPASAERFACQLGYTPNVTIHESPGPRGVGGELRCNWDGTAENAYCWQIGGVVPPDYGAWAECYSEAYVAEAHFYFTQTGYYLGQTMDLYLWEDTGGLPGNVLFVSHDLSPGPIGFWPSCSAHKFPVETYVPDHFIGFWGNWPDQQCGWFICADEDGLPGCPVTKFAPGIGYPTGWGPVDLVPIWQPQSIGLCEWTLANQGCCWTIVDSALHCISPVTEAECDPDWNWISGGECGTPECGANLVEPPCRDPLTTPCPICIDCCEEEADNPTHPVYLFSGEFYTEVVDLRIPGRGLDFIWTRKYRSRIGPNTEQGNGWDFSYNINVDQSRQGVVLNDGNSRKDTYSPQPDGTYARDEFFREGKVDSAGSFNLKFSDTGDWRFHPPEGNPWDGKIQEITDRNENTLSFEYDDQGRLVKVIDTLDREIDIAYNAEGFLESVTDFAGRQVTYEYYGDGEDGGSLGDLKSVTSPVVDSTAIFPIPSGHAFPDGKTTTYTYTTGYSDERLNHNLLTITDPKGQTYLTNIYADTEDPGNTNFDRVIGQIWGDPGDSLQIAYIPQDPAPENNFSVMRTIVNDRMGNVRESFYDLRNRRVMKREFTGRADPDLWTTDSDNRPTGKLRPDHDPDYFETRYEYNADSKLTRMIYPEGNRDSLVYEYDLDPDAPRRSRGNLREKWQLPGPRGSDQPHLAEFFEYDDGMGGCCGTNFVILAVNARGDSTLHEYDDYGNRIHTRYPIPTIVEDWEYNEYGQMTKHTHPDNGSESRREDVFTYYESGPQKGYPREGILDEPNFRLTTTYEYDLVGNPIRVIDARGHDALYIYNQLNQVVREISPAVTDGSGIRYTTDTFYDANDNIVRVDVTNIDEEGVPRPNEWITTSYDYEILNEVIRKTQEVDSLHNVVTEYEYDANRNRALTRYGEATGGDQDPETPGSQARNTLSVRYDERDLVFLEIRAEGDSLQSTTQYDYDGSEHVVKTLEGLEENPRVHLTEYDGYDRATTQTDPMGNVTPRHYDPNGNLISVRTEGEPFDVEGNINNVRLFEVSYRYDAMDRDTLEVIEFFNTETQAPILDGTVATRKEYSGNSRVTRVIDDNGHSTETLYDTMNRVLTTIDAKGNTVTQLYDGNSNVIAVREVEKSDLGNPDEQFVTTYTYDNLNRLVKVTDNASQVTQYGFDSRNTQTVQIDALRNTVCYEYDGLNRLLTTSRILTDNGLGSGTPVDTIVTRRNWDDTSRLIEQADDNGNSTRYDYDALNRLTDAEYADGTTLVATYDAHDNRTARLDANGTTASATYDLLDRLTGRTIDLAEGVLGTTQETYQYDGLSRMVVAMDDDSRVERKYDSLSHVTWETLTRLDPGASGWLRPRRQDGQTTVWLYDGLGNLLSCTYPGGREVACSYDELDRKKTISDQDGTIATYSYIGPGRVEQREYPKQLPQHTTRTTYSYDWVKRITGSTHVRDPRGAAEVIDARTYTWDAMSNKIERADIRVGGPRLKHRYTYDSIYRLTHTRVTDPQGATIRDTDYDLDGVGNRTLVTGDNCPGPYTMDPTFPEPADFQVNQYTTTPCGGRLYDKNGNLIRVDDGLLTQRDFSYDYRNQMVDFSDRETGTTATYAYDALGRRIRKVVTPRTVIFADDFKRPDSPTVGNGWVEEEPPPASVVLQDSTMRLTGQPGDDALHAFAYHTLTGTNSEFRALCKIKALNVQSLRGTRMTLWSDRGGPNQAVLRVFNTADNAGIFASKSGFTSDTMPTVGPLSEFFFMEIEVNGTMATAKIWQEADPKPSEPQLQIDLNDVGMAGFVPDEISFIGWNYDPVTSVVEFVTVTQSDTPAIAATDFCYDGWQVIEEQDEAGSSRATYVYGLYIDEVLNMQCGRDDFYYHIDDIYNIVGITDAGGAVVERYGYQDYGQPEFFEATGDPIPTSSIDNPFLWNGRRYDSETEWFYYRTRYLDPIAGRFTTRDAVGIWGDPGNVGNGLAYSRSSPFTYMDPLGLKVTLARKNGEVMPIEINGQKELYDVDKVTVKCDRWEEKDCEGWNPEDVLMNPTTKLKSSRYETKVIPGRNELVIWIIFFQTHTWCGDNYHLMYRECRCACWAYPKLFEDEFVEYKDFEHTGLRCEDRESVVDKIHTTDTNWGPWVWDQVKDLLGAGTSALKKEIESAVAKKVKELGGQLGIPGSDDSEGSK